MRIQIEKQMIEKTGIKITNIKSMICGDCTQLIEITETHRLGCKFYYYNTLVYDEKKNVLRCYECIRSGKELD